MIDSSSVRQILLILACTRLGCGTDVMPISPPQNPSLLSTVAMIWRSGVDGPAPGPKGPVRQVTWEKQQLFAGQPGKGLSPDQRIIVKYDTDQHETERADESLSSGGTCRTNSTWSKGRIAKQEHSCSGRSGITNVWWSKWTYNPIGRVAEFRQHSETGEPRYFYHYDTKERMIGWDYYQWADNLFSHAKIRYTGNSVETDTYDHKGILVASQTQTLDGAGRVIDLKASEVRDGKMTLWYHTDFKYDQQGRIVEQDTDPYTVGVGADNAPLPGKLTVRYDDANNTIEQLDYDTAGKLASDELAQLDRNGVPVSFRQFGKDGKPETGSFLVIDEKTGRGENRKGELFWNVTYDDHGNWTERQATFTPADGSPKVLVRVLRQTIEYR